MHLVIHISVHLALMTIDIDFLILFYLELKISFFMNSFQWKSEFITQGYRDMERKLIRVLWDGWRLKNVGSHENPDPVPGTLWLSLSSLCYDIGNILNLPLEVRSYKTDPNHTTTEQGSSPGRGWEARVVSPLPPSQTPCPSPPGTSLRPSQSHWSSQLPSALKSF